MLNLAARLNLVCVSQPAGTLFLVVKNSVTDTKRYDTDLDTHFYFVSDPYPNLLSKYRKTLFLIRKIYARFSSSSGSVESISDPEKFMDPSNPDPQNWKRVYIIGVIIQVGGVMV